VVVPVAVALVLVLEGAVAPVVVAAPLLVVRPRAWERLLHAESDTATPPPVVASQSKRRRLSSKRGPSLTLAPSPLSSRF
jgi:uncharacterized protein YjeT (DUF2065 family)